MKDARPKPEPPVWPAPAGTGRTTRLRRAGGLIVLIFALGFSAACPAEELDPAERGPRLSDDPQIAALEQALANAARKMAQARVNGEQAPPPEPVSHLGANVAGALLIATLLAALRFAPAIVRRVRPWIPKLAGPKDLAATLLEEPSIIAFFESLKDGPAGPVAGTPAQAQAPTTEPAAGPLPNPLREFYEATPRRLAELRTLLSEISRSTDEAARQTKLLECFERATALRESAGQPEVLPVWQVVFALEGLLKRLSTKPAELTPSVVRTAAGALDVLERLCRQRVKPDLVTEPPVRILAVDDDPISRRAISLALAKLFNAPDLAPDGPVALSLAGRQAYDVIFLDVEMPGMDGFEVCSRIHEMEINRATPVVFVTRHSDFDSRAKSTLKGGDGLLGKPFLVFEVVLKAITLVLQSRLGQAVAEPGSAAPAPEPQSRAGVSPALPDLEIADPGRRDACPILVPGPDARLQAAEAAPEPSGAPTFLSASGGESKQPAGMSALPPSGDSARAGNQARNSGGDKHPASEPPRPRGLAKALSADALASLQELQERLQAAQPDAEPAAHLEFLGEFYLAVHAVCAEAQHAGLDAAFRLGSALENMLKKLLERPKSWTPSNVQAAAAALELLLEMCRTGANPDLARPPVQLLVVDDDPVARRAISGTLQLAFGRPDSAESGEAALKLAREKAFDLIFLDVQMPGMDGFAACSRIHQTRRNGLTPVIFVTSYDDQDSRAKAAASGGCGFVPKQVLASQLTLVALSFILRSRLGRRVPTLEAPPPPMGNGSEPTLPELSGQEAALVASAVEAAS